MPYGLSRYCKDLPAASGCCHPQVAEVLAVRQAVFRAADTDSFLAGQVLVHLHAGAVQDALTDQYTDQLRDLREAGLAQQTEQVRHWLVCVYMSLQQPAARLSGVLSMQLTLCCVLDVAMCAPCMGSQMAAPIWLVPADGDACDVQPREGLLAATMTSCQAMHAPVACCIPSPSKCEAAS